MTDYLITVSGCDDRTRVRVDLNPDEVAVIDRVAERITQASDSSCQPRMSICRADEVSEDDEW